MVQPTAIGDTILSSGLLVRLQELYPEARLHVFHGASNREVIPLIEAKLIAHEVDFFRPWLAVPALRALQLDLVIDLCPWPRLTALVAASAGAKCTIGFASEGQYRHYLYDISVKHSCSRHEIANLEEFARQLGSSAPYWPSIRRDLPRPVDAPNLDRIVIFHPCAGGARAREKAWPVAHWVALAAAVTKTGYMVALSGTAADTPAIESIVAKARESQIACTSLAGRFSLAELGYTLQSCRLLVTVDNGVMHLGAALGCPLVSLHGPTRAWRWGPVSKTAIGLDSPHPAAGYVTFGFERPPHNSYDVMAALSVKTVWNAVYQRLVETESTMGQALNC